MEGGRQRARATGRRDGRRLLLSALVIAFPFFSESDFSHAAGPGFSFSLESGLAALCPRRGSYRSTQPYPTSSRKRRNE